MQETCVQSLGWEDPLEEGMATHSSIPAWIIPQTEEPGGLHSIGLQKVRHNWSDWACTHGFARFKLWGTAKLYSTMAIPFYIPTIVGV